MKLQQGQTWKLGEQYIRIARLERLAVEYKIIADLVTKAGQRHRATKKEFCRLVKGAVLTTSEDLAAARDTNGELLSPSEINAA
ncbi:MAG: hypothetical protein ABIQ35_00610 [Verrucomicrobiota bacterium]